MRAGRQGERDNGIEHCGAQLMPGFGFGFGAVSASRLFATFGAETGPPALSPSTAWDGSAGSGFSNVPVDPLRTTAKPVCRLLTPPRQWFTDEIIVGVSAAANNDGSLLDNLGLEKVVVHFEGSTHEVTSPSYYLLEDANGVPRKYLGWWVVLKKPEATAGHANVYFEAVPKDTAMQSRVIGPHQYSPQNVLHDATIEVDATPAEITGERYKTVSAAINYARTQAFENPLIRVTGSEDQLLPRGWYNYKLPNGWVTVEGTVPFKFYQSLDYAPDPTYLVHFFRPRVWGMHFRGNNVTFDFANTTNYVSEAVAADADNNVWLDGINAENSRGAFALYRGGPASISSLWGGNPWITECNMNGLAYGASGANLVRGGTFTSMVSDLFDDSVCVIGTKTDDFTSAQWSSDLAALSVRYDGSAATATVELSGAVGAYTRILTLKEDDVSVGAFTIKGDPAGWAADTNYTFEHVVDWINTLTDWNATLIDNERAAAWLGVSGGSGNAFAATDAKSSLLTLYANIAVHADWWQLRNGSWAVENTIIADNVTSDMECQALFIAATTDARDLFAINNIFHTVGPLVVFSQFGKGVDHSHVVIAHNSWTQQGVIWRTDFGLDMDVYCLFANNVAPTLKWGGVADADLVIADNHIFAGAIDIAGATGTTIGGDEVSVFANAAAGDFAPVGELLTNLKTPVLKYDRTGSARGATAAAGAFAQ